MTAPLNSRALAPALLAVALVAGPVAAQVPGENDHLPGRALRLMTYNIQTGNLYSTTGEQIGNDPARAADVIAQFAPDFVALQEVRNSSQAASIASALGYNHHFGCATSTLGGLVCTLGNAVLTPHPVTSTQTHVLPQIGDNSRRVMVEVRATVDGQAITVYSCHLNFNSTEDKRHQVLGMMDVISQRTGPRVLMGDFNDQDDRPNSYSGAGFINVITGSAHGTLLPAQPKMLDLHRKAAHWSQVKNDPPYYTLRDDFADTINEANTVSQWAPRVRIDHIFLSPEFHLGAPHSVAWAVDTGPIMQALQGQFFHVSDHRPVYGEVLLPKPPVQLFLNPQEGPTVLSVGESRTILAGAIDEDGNAVSLLRTDPSAPRGSFRSTNRMASGVEWIYTGTGGGVQRVDVLAGYDAFRRLDRPAEAAARFTATEPGQGTLHALVDGVIAHLDILVIPAGEPYTIGPQEGDGAHGWVARAPGFPSQEEQP